SKNSNRRPEKTGARKVVRLRGAGKTIVLGVTGSIAAYKSAELASLLVKQGHNVFVVMTRDATEFITPLTLQTLPKNPVMTNFSVRAGKLGIGGVARDGRPDARADRSSALAQRPVIRKEALRDRGGSNASWSRCGVEFQTGGCRSTAPSRADVRFNQRRHVRC